MAVSKREKVLVADSDLTALSRIYLYLLHQDFRVEACNDATEIWQRVERFKPGVVLIRASMEGLEEKLLDQLQAVPLPVVLLKEEEAEIDSHHPNIIALSSGIELSVLARKLRELSRSNGKGRG